MQVTFNPEKMIKNLTIFEKKDLPSMSVIALNRALFDTRKDIQNAARDIFRNPVPYTLNSFLYRKAKFAQPEALLFINESRAKGNAPASYLLPSILGSKAYPTRFQGALLNTVVMNAEGRNVQASQRSRVMLPSLNRQNGKKGRYVRTNKYGNMSPGQYTQILSSLRGGISSADVQETGPTMKPQDLATNDKYVYLDSESLDHPYFKNRFNSYPKTPGIYYVRRVKSKAEEGPRYTNNFYRVMRDQKIPRNRQTFDFQNIAAISIEKNFVTQLSKILRERRG
jgi:hypothetical protein